MIVNMFPYSHEFLISCCGGAIETQTDRHTNIGTKQCELDWI